MQHPWPLLACVAVVDPQRNPLATRPRIGICEVFRYRDGRHVYALGSSESEADDLLGLYDEEQLELVSDRLELVEMWPWTHVWPGEVAHVRLGAGTPFDDRECVVLDAAADDLLVVEFADRDEAELLPPDAVRGTGERSPGPRAPYWSPRMTIDADGREQDTGDGRTVLDTLEDLIWRLRPGRAISSCH